MPTRRKRDAAQRDQRPCLGRKIWVLDKFITRLNACLLACQREGGNELIDHIERKLQIDRCGIINVSSNPEALSVP